MAAPQVKFYACLDSGVGLRQKLIDSGPTALWPFSDMYGGVDGGGVEEVVNDLDGTEDNISRGDPGLLPEYGCSMSFANLRYVTVPTNALFASSTSLAVGMMFKLGAAGAAQTIAHRSGHFLFNITAANVLTFGCHIAGTFRDVSYTITDTADWIANPRFLVGRYTGAALQIYEITSAGVVNQLASTTSWTGSAAPVSADAIWFGRTNTGTNYLSGAMQYATLWINDYPTDGELTDFATSIKWTEITSDVDARLGFTAKWGIPESSPAARCGEPGITQFTLRNGRTNAGQPRGYYAIGHASCRTGFALGIMVRLDMIDPAAPSAVSQRFIGRLIAAPASTGYFRPTVECTVTDYFDELQRAQLPSLPIVQGESYASIVGKILTGLAVRPHAITGSNSAGTVFPYGLDQAQDEESSTLDELERLAVSEWGYLTMRAGGALRREDRQERQVTTTADWEFADTDIHGLELERTTREEIITKVQVAVYPRTESASSAATVFTLGAPLKFEPGQTRIIQMPYTDPDNPDTRVGVVHGTHALGAVAVNTAEDGSGATTQLTGYYEHGANSTKAFLTNSLYPYPVWLRTFSITGKTVSTYKAVNMNAEADDVLRGRVGDNLFRVEQPYSDDPSDAGNLANHLLAALQVERPSARRLTLRATAAASADVIDCVVNVQVGDLLHLTHALSGIDDDYFVNGIQLRGRKADKGTEVVAELVLARRERQAWVLGVAGFSEPGLTTYPGY